MSRTLDIISKQSIKQAKDKDLIEKWTVDLDYNHSVSLPHSFQCLKEMEGFLPCCPFDCQTSMDLDVQIDDLLQMEKELLDSKDEMNFPIKEIDDNGHKISDYCLANLSSTEHEKSTSEVINNSKKFCLEDTLEKSVILSDNPSTSLIDTNSKNNVIITNSENPSQISSVSKAFIINIFEGSNDIESFQDLNSFLKQELHNAHQDHNLMHLLIFYLMKMNVMNHIRN